MCTSPIHIKNPSHYISLDRRDRLYIDVPCGKCPECRALASLQWYQRAIVEFQSCVERGGYTLFDTLTYAPASLPKFSDFFDTSLDMPCFNRKHITDFLKRLRVRLQRHYGYTGLRYYIVSEYGTSAGCTHRPHYHCLFYVDKCIDPVQLSMLISDCWPYGRTDGVKYRGSYYLFNRCVFTGLSDKSRYSVISYVSKYVNKSCEFDKEIWKRVFAVVENLTSTWTDKQKASWRYKALKRQVYNTARQFHRQSVGFGAQILTDVDLFQLQRDGGLPVRLVDKLVAMVPLSTYYKRKLFYECVDLDGVPTWQLNDIGIEFVPLIEQRKKDMFLSKFRAVDVACNGRFSQLLRDLDYSPDDFAVYALSLRGCVKSFAPVYRVTDKLDDTILFHYGCESDEKYFGFRFYSRSYCGNRSAYMPPRDVVSIQDIEDKYLIKDKQLEAVLTDFYKQCSVNYKAVERDSFMKLKERLSNIYKQYFSQSAF